MDDAVNKKQFTGKELKQAKRVRQARSKEVREVFDSAFFHTSPTIFTFCATFALTLSFLFTFSALPAATAGDIEQNQQAKETQEQIYIVSEYRYVPAHAADDQEIGHSLCGTRCNALSSNINNIMEPGGWSLVRISSNKEIMVELKSPFLGGQCICIADEYRVNVVDSGGPRSQRPNVQGKVRDR